MSNMRPLRFRDTASAVLFLAFLGCAGTGTIFPSAPGSPGGAVLMGGTIPAPVIRQPVLPEYLVGCRGHVLVPAPGLTFGAKGAPLPTAGQFVREEKLTAPYRVIRPVNRTWQERSFDLLNVELDAYSRVIGLACG